VGTCARLHRSRRLQSSRIKQLLSSGKMLRARDVNVLVAPNECGYARFAVVAPKRVFALAVERNREKRVVREWFRLQQQRLGERDLLIRLTRKPGAAGTATVLEQLERLLIT
jgi:ribonuclease P protein component